jgi:hypothetical protein
VSFSQLGRYKIFDKTFIRAQGSGAEPSSDDGEAVVLGCTQFLRTGSCAYGDACKYSHASIALSATQRTSSEHKHHHTPAAAAAAEKENEGASTYEALPRETKRAIDHLLRKTKMCHAFNKATMATHVGLRTLRDTMLSRS